MSLTKLPIDYRDESWEQVRPRVPRLGLAVLQAFREAGPCTTRELSRRSGLNLLMVRPRVTELCQLGLVVLTDDDRAGREGIYRALSDVEIEEIFARRRAEARGTRVQAELPITL